MGIAGVGSYNYANNYRKNVNKHSNQTSAHVTYDSGNINEKKNFKSMVQEFMKMQYDAGNISGHLSYKQFYDYMDDADSQEDYSMMLERHAEKVKENIKNGETDSEVAGITRYCNGKEVNYKKDMLHDRKMYDAETGVTWYLNDERGPYMSGEDSEKFRKWCDVNGVVRLKKFAEMTGLTRSYPDGTTAYVGDNGIAVNGKDGTEVFFVEYSNVSWNAMMDALDHLQGNPLDQQTWNKVMQDYAEKKMENSKVTER